MSSLNIKIALRNFFKFPLYSLLNLVGLSLGIAASFVILTYVHRQLTYDHQFKDAGRIYRVSTDFYNMGGFAKSQNILHHALATECKDVETTTRLDRAWQEVNVKVGNAAYLEAGAYYIDSSFFNLFNYSFTEGTPRPLSLNEIVLSESLAKKYFGNELASGSTIEVGKEKKPYTVAGVFKENTIYQSHLKPSFFLSIYSYDNLNDANWNSATVYNYVKLKPTGTQAGFETELNSILKSNVFPTTGFNGSFGQWQASNNAVKFFVQPLKDIYLHSNYKFEATTGGNLAMVNILMLIGIFIIFIAAINYVNLTTARSSLRTKEVGVKKTLGARRSKLIGQFLTESILFSLIAMIVALLLSQLLLNIFSKITAGQLPTSIFSHWQYLVAFVVFSLVIGAIAGIYPAFYLTAFKTLNVLKGNLSVKNDSGFRTFLVVVQFAIAIFLVIGSAIVYQQLFYMLHKDAGFEKEGVIIVDNAGYLEKNVSAFKKEIERQSEVVSTSFNNRTPAGNSVWMYTYRTAEMDHDLTLQTFPCDDQYIPTLGLRLTAGRNFSPLTDNDTTAAIINEAAVKELGLKDPIGAEINHGLKVIGVIRDFNFQSLRDAVPSEVLRYYPEGGLLAIKLRGNDISGFISAMKKTWKQFAPDEAIQYSFLDENFRQLMVKEQTLSKVIAFFTLFAIVIACLGLFGLASFTAEQRTKEIGIRKVLGASVAGIVSLLTKDFVKPVLIAVLIAFPVAWWSANKWLQDYAYRVSIEWWVFVLAGVAALLIAWITVSFQAIKAAVSNPVEALRSE